MKAPAPLSIASLSTSSTSDDADARSLWNREQLRTALRNLASPEHLFAGLVGLLVIILLTRALAIRTAGDMGIRFPVMSYADVLMWAGLAWGFYGLFHLTHSAYIRAVVAAVGWLLILILLGLRMVYLLIYIAVGHPLTYHMMALSGAAVEVSFELAVRAARPMVPAAFICLILIAEMIWLVVPSIGKNLYRRFYTLQCVAVLAFYVGVGNIWMIEHPNQAELVANPEYVLISSYFEQEPPSVTDSIPDAYFSDFLPNRQPVPRPSGAPGCRAHRAP